MLSRIVLAVLATALLLAVAPAAGLRARSQTPNTWGSGGTMTGPRYGHTATLLASGKVLVAGGYNNAQYLTSAELYDPSTNGWSTAAPMAAARAAHTATLLPSGKVLVAGGSDDVSSLATAELYDPVANTWSNATSPSTARSGHTATLLQSGKVLVAGGSGATAELYDPGTNLWSPTGSMNAARGFHTATLLAGGKVLVTGGYNGSALATAELYDPVAGKWSPAGSMSSARWQHTATLLPGGKVLVAGGTVSGFDALASADLYDPGTGTWSPAAGMSAGRIGPTATLLPTGIVLVAGGFHGGSLASAELYDPAANSWSAADSMAGAREAHTATLLQTGELLVAGGGNNGPLKSAELYHCTCPRAAITSPTPGTKLAGTTVSFQWTAGSGASQYDFMVGSTDAGSYNVVHSGNITATSYQASGLTSDGGTLYVTLWSHFSSGWQSVAYTYTAHGGIPAAITDPVSGTTLGGGSATFQWSAGRQVTQYWLDLGTQYPGSKDVYDQDQGQSLGSASIPIPQCGGRLYVRVWSKIDGAWQPSDAWYTENGVAQAATITSPPHGTLLGTSVQFQWNGCSAAAHELWVGDTGPTSYNLYRKSEAQSTSDTVNTIPQHGGGVYVTLWSYINEVWQQTSASFVEQGAASPAAMTSPAPNSTLAGTSQLFQWSAGSGVTWYYLRVGTTYRGTEVYNADQGQSTSRTVSGIPTGGHTLYVTLWSYIDGAYQAADYTYTEAP